MLKIDTYLAQSSVHGMGLFAANPIAKGDVIWKYDPLIDQIYSKIKFKKLIDSLDPIGLKQILTATYKRNQTYFYLADNARFINHTETGYNIFLIDDYTEVAIQDIDEGEEILENYYLSYDDDDFFMLEMKKVDVLRVLLFNYKKKRNYAGNKNIFKRLPN
ncbi:MAG: SET domain-containing protein-lysine N-methyltransferase [Pseudomonadota bacterium]